MNGPMSGTSIQELQQLQQMQYGGMQNMQHEQGHNAAYSIQQSQHLPYYNPPGNYNSSYQNIAGPSCPYSSSMQGMQQGIQQRMQQGMQQGMQPQRRSQQEYPDIEDLAKDIAGNLPVENFNSGMDAGLTYDEDLVVKSKPQSNVMSNIPKLLREPIIIVILYVILSHPLVFTTLGKYIKQINPDETGRVSFLGILIYGIILATLFSITKKFLLK